MADGIKPLTPEEVDALEAIYGESKYAQYPYKEIRGLLATVRDRELQRDEAYLHHQRVKTIRAESARLTAPSADQEPSAR